MPGVIGGTQVHGNARGSHDFWKQWSAPGLDAVPTGAELDPVGNGGLHAVKEEQAAGEDERDGKGGSEKKQARSVAAAGDGPAEAVDDAGHGVEAVEPAPVHGDEG